MPRRLQTVRHSWGEKIRFLYKSEQTCERCDTVRVTRHEGDQHWTEFWRDGTRIECDATPPCDTPEISTTQRGSHVGVS